MININSIKSKFSNLVSKIQSDTRLKLLTFVAIFALVGGAVYFASAKSLLDGVDFQVYSPVDDSYADQQNPDQNYGQALDVRVDNDSGPCSTNQCGPPNRQHAYFKFDVDRIPAGKRIQRAMLRVHTTADTASRTPRGGTVTPGNNNNWSENSLTWNNRPGSDDDKVLSTRGRLGNNRWYNFELDMTKGYITNNGTYTLVVKTDNQDGTMFDSDESESFKPLLFIVLESIPGAVAPTLSISASPQSVSSGGASTISWTSSNATECLASGAWSGAQVLSGSISTGALTATSSYTLECSGAGGKIASTATVTVSSPTAPPTTSGGVSGPGIALSNSAAFKSQSEIAFELDNAKAAGAKWIREDVGWGINSQYTYHVNQILARGMKVYATLGSSGTHAFGGSASAKYDATNILKLVNDLVPHYYAMGIRDFEVLNEPNLNNYSASEYLSIVRAAYPRIKQLAPDARVWVGAVGIGSSARDQFNNFVKPMFPAITSYLDGFSIHASDEPYPSTSGARWWSMQAWTWGPVGGDITGTIRQLLDSSGGSTKPIILSEYNFPDNKLGNANDLNLQATRVAENIKDTRYVGVANFTMLDADFPTYSMLRIDKTKKPVWDAFRQAATSQ